MANEKRPSDLKRAFTEDGSLKTHVGGQALLEGVMMRGKYNWSAAVRKPDGTIYTEEHDLTSGKKKHAWMRWPLVRGCVAFVESLVLGYKAMDVAAQHSYDDDGYTFFTMAEKPADMAKAEAKAQAKAARAAERQARKAGTSSRGGKNPDGRAASGAISCQISATDSAQATGVPLNDAAAHSEVPVSGGISAPVKSMAAGLDDASSREPVPVAAGDEAAASAVASPEEGTFFSGKETAISMIIGLVLGIALFIIIPAVLSNLIVGEYDSNPLLWNIVDGILRVAVFVGYIWLIGRMKDINHMFGYHGAEHKTIHCYEHGLPLTPENARSFPRLHVRCGTAFLIMVMIIAILVYTILPVQALIAAWGVADGAPKLILVILVRILFLPLIAGISYEITVKWAGSHPENPAVKVILWPGMQMQYLTTREPDDSQLECAIAAMKLVLEREELEEAAKEAVQAGVASDAEVQEELRVDEDARVEEDLIIA